VLGGHVIENGNEYGKKFGFEFHSSGEKNDDDVLILAAETEEDRVKWMTCLSSHAKSPIRKSLMFNNAAGIFF
jgi:hypothetical protein